MAKQQPIIDDQTPTELTIPIDEFNRVLDDRIAIGLQIFNRKISNQVVFDASRKDFSNWNDYNSEYLKHAFNKKHNEYKEKYDNSGSLYTRKIGILESKANAVKFFKNKVNSKLDNLIKLRAKTNLLKTSVRQEFDLVEKAKEVYLEKSQVFIVHGHDDLAKVETARFIEQLGFKPIILHEQASSGLTIIEKIENYSNVGFGVVLYTPCDIGAKKGKETELKHRARQNVVFEHGYLIGKIGRKNIAALVKGDIETPNDISGVVYISMNNDWKLDLAKELKNSGYPVDMNKVI